MFDSSDAPAVIASFAFYLLLAPCLYFAPWRGRGRQAAFVLHVVHRSWIIWRTLAEVQRWKRGQPVHLLRDWLTDAEGLLVDYWGPFLLQAIVGGALIAIARKEGKFKLEWRSVWPWLIPDAVLIGTLIYLASVIAQS